jgi:hypothetical protein
MAGENVLTIIVVTKKELLVCYLFGFLRGGLGFVRFSGYLFPDTLV